MTPQRSISHPRDPRLGVWFSYAADAPLLRESVEAFRTAAGEGARVAIFDDAAAPLGEDFGREIGADFWRETGWKRGGNLNGWEAVDGVLSGISEACAETGAKGAVKVDSDTVISGLSWADPGAPMAGFCPGLPATCKGFAYWLQKGAAEVILRGLQGRWRDPFFPAPEDQTVSAEALAHFGPRVHVHHWRTMRLAGGVDWRGGNDPEAFKEAEVVTFGNRGARSKAEVAEAMRRWRVGRELP